VSRILVAGVGNIFLGDDAFGVEVVRRLGAVGLGDGVDVGDFGIAGIHLAYQLLDGYDAAVLVDATPRGGRPGDLYVIEPAPAGDDDGPALDAHGMQPEAVLRLVEVLGGHLGRVLVVGCEPAAVTEGIGLSPEVEASVDRAVELVAGVVAGLASGVPEEEEEPCAS
jgi:hydrogenase maturation protease